MTARRRSRINRVFLRDVMPAGDDSARDSYDVPRRLGCTAIDFSTLHLPAAVSGALAEAFWNLVGVRSDPTVRGYWYNAKVFGRFAAETQAVRSLHDVDSALIVRYIEWLNTQRAGDGVPWSKVTRYSTYTSLRTLLQWLQRWPARLIGRDRVSLQPLSVDAPRGSTDQDALRTGAAYDPQSL